MKNCVNCYWFNGEPGDGWQFCDAREIDVKEDNYCLLWREKWPENNPTPKVIVINGSGGTGKSTFISLCHEIDPRVVETSTVDFVKEIALRAGWDGNKDETGRRFLSDLKDAMEKYHDIPNKKIDEFIQSHPDNIIFVNAREPHNIQYYKDKYNAITAIVINPNVQQVQGNHADENVYDYEYDIYIENSGSLELLKDTARFFLDNLDNL